MPTLHIEHAIVDYELWKSAFDRFADSRRQSGVLAHRIHRPVDDPAYVVVDLDFETAEAARRFLAFLQDEVWASRDTSPALIGTPSTTILETA
jgi:hypothetical protein